MFSNQLQDDFSYMTHQTTSTFGSIGFPPPPPITSIVATNNNHNHLSGTSVVTTALDPNYFNCNDIPTCCTTLRVRSTPLCNMATDIASMISGASENFSPATVSNHLRYPPYIPLIMPSSGPTNGSNFDLQDKHTQKNWEMQHLSSANQNHIYLDDSQNQQNLLQNDYISFLSDITRKAGFVSPINFNSIYIPQSGKSKKKSGSNLIFYAKTQVAEDFDKDNDSAANNITDNIISREVTKKEKAKNSSKTNIKHVSKNSNKRGRRTKNEDSKTMSAKEEYLQQFQRKEQNRLSESHGRPCSPDVNKLEAETAQLESEKVGLEAKVKALQFLVTKLQDKLDQHKCTMNNESVSTINHHTNTILDSSDNSLSLSALIND